MSQRRTAAAAAKLLSGTTATAGLSYVAYDHQTQHPMRQMHVFSVTESFIRLHNACVRSTSSWPKTMTLENLKQYDGRNGRPMYFAAGGMVYDASSSAMFRSSYSQWAGRDATIALAIMSLDPSDINRTDWDTLNAQDFESLHSWTNYFDQKYWIRGRLKEYADM